MAVVLSTNTLADAVHRRLAQSTNSLAASFSRISSGSRLVTPKDDVAGRAIADGLRVDSRVFVQAVRNINDSISATSIAEGALAELSSIVERQLELAEQSANQTLGSQQRAALNKEAQNLADEYSRITQSTSFNTARLLDGSFAAFRTQAGYGEQATLDLSIGAILNATVGTAVGDGSFRKDATVFALGPYDSTRKVASGDVDGDGAQDIIELNFYDYDPYQDLGIQISRGNGDGTFKPQTLLFGANANTRDIVLTDLNGDGRDDLILAQSQLEVRYGQADGTFGAAQYYAGSGGTRTLTLADVNSDSRLDVVTSCLNGSNVYLLKADGTFEAARTASTLTSTPNDTEVGDVNGDGKLDLINSSDRVWVQLGNGDGSFKQAVSHDIFFPSEIELADLNKDGKLDVLGISSTHAAIMTGDGNGGFVLSSTFNIGSSSQSLAIGDFNEDGFTDFSTASYGENLFAVFIGNGNGTFKTRTTYAAPAKSIAWADFNGDQLLDAVVSGNKSACLFEGGGVQVAGSFEINLSTIQGARSALDTLREVMQGVLSERGNIGSALSRLSTSLANMQSARTGYEEAGSRITDVDIAAETASLVRTQILQQAGSALLAQAGTAPQIALQLLRSG